MARAAVALWLGKLKRMFVVILLVGFGEKTRGADRRLLLLLLANIEWQVAVATREKGA